jgi:hypothetical protein
MGNHPAAHHSDDTEHRGPFDDDARALIGVAGRLGAWSPALHTDAVRRPMRHRLSELGPDELSCELGWWSSEYGRLCEVSGVLTAQSERLRLEARTARAQARNRIRTATTKTLSATAVNDQAEDDPVVLDADRRLCDTDALRHTVEAARDATDRYLSSLSREIAFRDAQMRARLY